MMNKSQSPGCSRRSPASYACHARVEACISTAACGWVSPQAARRCLMASGVGVVAARGVLRLGWLGIVYPVVKMNYFPMYICELDQESAFFEGFCIFVEHAANNPEFSDWAEPRPDKAVRARDPGAIIYKHKAGGCYVFWRWKPSVTVDVGAYFLQAHGTYPLGCLHQFADSCVGFGTHKCHRSVLGKVSRRTLRIGQRLAERFFTSDSDEEFSRASVGFRQCIGGAEGQNFHDFSLASDTRGAVGSEVAAHD